MEYDREAWGLGKVQWTFRGSPPTAFSDHLASDPDLLDQTPQEEMEESRNGGIANLAGTKGYSTNRPVHGRYLVKRKYDPGFWILELVLDSSEIRGGGLCV